MTPRVKYEAPRMAPEFTPISQKAVEPILRPARVLVRMDPGYLPFLTDGPSRVVWMWEPATDRTAIAVDTLDVTPRELAQAARRAREKDAKWVEAGKKGWETKRINEATRARARDEAAQRRSA